MAPIKRNAKKQVVNPVKKKPAINTVNKKAAPNTRSKKQAITEPPEQADPNPVQEVEEGFKDFVSLEAKSLFRKLINRKVILERGIINKPPFEAYIKKHKWYAFTQSPSEANITMATEFYANFRFRDEGVVLCRGKQVPISPSIINEYYGLSSDPALYEEFRLVREEVSSQNVNIVGGWGPVLREITQPDIPIEQIVPTEEWNHIDKKHLTTDMNVWYSFIASRILPVTINSEVGWQRVRLLYALKKNMAFNVGSLIFSCMENMLSTSTGIRFHSLISGLCHRAGCQERMDDCFKPPMAMLTYEAFQRRIKQVHSKPSSIPSPTSTITLEGLSESINQMNTRIEMIERSGKYVRQLCEHTAKVLSILAPDAIAVVGPFPTPPIEEDHNVQLEGEREGVEQEGLSGEEQAPVETAKVDRHGV